MVLIMTGCSDKTQEVSEQYNEQSGSDSESDACKSWQDLNIIDQMELKYAKQFTVDYYEEGYKLISVMGEDRYLLVPEAGIVPDGIPSDIVVVTMPVDNIYLVATPVMDLFRVIDGIDNIKFSGTKESGWYIQEAKDKMNQGDIIYAGKYNAPDYELLIGNACDLAIENTMIY